MPEARSVTVAVTADLAARYTVFAACLTRLVMPEGSEIRWHLGSDISANRNRAVNEAKTDYIWFIDDDHAFQPYLLLRLLSHKLPVVAPVCLRRNGNFLPTAVVNDRVFELGEQSDAALVPVQRTGTAGMLLQRDVFEKVPEPWFEMRNGRSEDYVFCDKLNDAGVDIHIDLGARLGHITTAVVWPTYEDGWKTGFQFADGFEVQIDAARQPGESGRPAEAAV